MDNKLTHFDQSGNARMVDVSSKKRKLLELQLQFQELE